MADHILVLVDSPGSGHALGDLLKQAGYQVTVTTDAEHAASVARSVRPAAAVIHWPGGNLMALLIGRLRTFWPLPVVALCDHEEVAVRALGAGAFEAIPRTTPKQVLLDSVKAAAEQGRRIMDGGHERLGTYDLLEILGRGGMSIVYRAKDTRDGHEVALKILRHDLAADSEYVARFQREAVGALDLKHPSLMEVHGSGKERGRLFIAQELVRGIPLDRIISEQAPLEPRRALLIARQIADGLGYAHARGLVHRDIKPANIHVDASDRVKIMDFGLLRTYRPDHTPITRSDEFIGTLLYAAPEQVRADPIDGRTDLYALGAVLFEMLAGSRSYMGRESAVLARKIASGQVPFQISALGPSIPDFIISIVARLINPYPEKRYQTATDVLTDIDSALQISTRPGA